MQLQIGGIMRTKYYAIVQLVNGKKGWYKFLASRMPVWANGYYREEDFPLILNVLDTILYFLTKEEAVATLELLEDKMDCDVVELWEETGWDYV